MRIRLKNAKLSVVGQVVDNTKIWSFHVVVPQRTAMNGIETGTVEYSTELAFNSNLPNLIVLNVAFYMHFIRQFDSAHVKCDV